MSYLVAALYKFVQLDDFQSIQSPLLEKCKAEDVYGTLLLAREGINGTIAGPEIGIRNVLDFISADNRIGPIAHKESWAGEIPFLRMRVRLKKEIVTMGVPTVNPNATVGTYVKPEDWNALISDPDVLVIDTRNDYEVEIGTFKGAVDPKTTSFREFPKWAQEAGLVSGNQKQKVAMFCTGGIRCEKSTAYLLDQGVEEVYHLQGGILKYLETVPEQDSLWEGQCFVFDQRVSVGHGLAQGEYDLCNACRRAIDDQDKASPKYQKGISCPKCYGTLSEKQLERFASRQKQMELAKARGEVHLGNKPISDS